MKINNPFKYFLELKPKDRLLFSVFGILSFLIILTFKDYGISWDENIQNMYGNYILKYYLSGLRERGFLNFPTINGYGGAFDTLVALLNKAHPLDKMAVRHLLTAFTGLLGIYGVFLITKLISGTKAGLLSVFFMVMLPTYYGFIFMNPKDIPFAVGYIFSIFYISKLILEFPDVKNKTIYWTGISIGFALGVRIGGILLLCYLGLFFSMYFFLRLVIQKNISVKSYSTIIKAGLKIFLISYIIMLFFWPWAQQKPFFRPIQALLFMSGFARENIEVFEGVWLNSFTAPFPRYYIYKYYLINLPEFIILFSTLGIPYILYRVLNQLQRIKIKHSIILLLLLFSILFPLGYLSFKNSPIYNGNRHFTFVLPSLIVVCSVFFYEAVYKKISQKKTLLFSLYIVAGIYFSYHIYTLVRIHPYQYIYYNSFIGGLKGAYNNYEMDYWTIANKEAVEKLVKHVKETNSNDFKTKIYKVAFCSDPLTIQHYLPKNFILSLDGKEADYLIRNDYVPYIVKEEDHPICSKKLDYKEALLGVERFGVYLTRVYDLRILNSKINP